jgi:hypothetical protein
MPPRLLEPLILKNIENCKGKCLILVVKDIRSLIFLLYFLYLVPSSPIAGPFRLKKIAEAVIPLPKIIPAISSHTN